MPPIASNTDNNDSISVTVSNKDSVPFNSDTDFVNFQLGEFGVTQRNFVFHLTQKETATIHLTCFIPMFV